MKSVENRRKQSQGGAIGVALIGCGYWGPNLVRNFHETPGTRMVSVCDTNSEHLRRIHSRYPFLKVTTSFEDILKDPAVDAVVIATPTASHYDLAREVILSGRHVWIEKPLARSLKEGMILCDLARKKRRVLLVDHTFVYSSPVRLMKRQLPGIGRLRYFDSVRINLGLFQRDINVIWDLAPHDLSILLYLIGSDPAEVMAVGAAHVNPGTENTAYVVARFKDGLIAHLHVNWLSPVKIRQTIICGEKKMLVYNDIDPIETVKIYDSGVDKQQIDRKTMMVDYRTGDVLSPRMERVEALRTACVDFESSIRSGKQPISDGPFGLRVLRILEATDRSIRKGGSFVKVLR